MIAGKTVYWIALAVAIAANVGANAILKSTMVSLPEDAGGVRWLAVLETWSFWAGIALLGIVFVSYLFALRNLSVSVAYIAVTSLAMVGTVLVEALVTGNPVGLGKSVGLCLIIAGLWLFNLPA